MHPLNIDILIHIISEYLDTECKQFLTFMNVSDKYKYLFFVYDEKQSAVCPNNARYLTVFENMQYLHTYTN